MIQLAGLSPLAPLAPLAALLVGCVGYYAPSSTPCRHFVVGRLDELSLSESLWRGTRRIGGSDFGNLFSSIMEKY